MLQNLHLLNTMRKYVENSIVKIDPKLIIACNFYLKTSIKKVTVNKKANKNLKITEISGTPFVDKSVVGLL